MGFMAPGSTIQPATGSNSLSLYNLAIQQASQRRADCSEGRDNAILELRLQLC